MHQVAYLSIGHPLIISQSINAPLHTLEECTIEGHATIQNETVQYNEQRIDLIRLQIKNQHFVLMYPWQICAYLNSKSKTNELITIRSNSTQYSSIISNSIENRDHSTFYSVK